MSCKHLAPDRRSRSSRADYGSEAPAGCHVGRAGKPGQTPPASRRRELEVLALLAEGMRNAEIAQRLVISQKTVDHHVSAVLRKLDARTRGEASATAFNLGLTRHDHRTTLEP